MNDVHTGTVVCCCRGRVGTDLSVPDAVVTVVLCFWRLVIVTPETCRAVVR